MYFNGEGVRVRSYFTAFKWYKLAAKQGDSTAQSNLGLMYSKGYGVTRNYALAYMWWNVALLNGDLGAKKNIDIITKKMPLRLIKKAKNLAKLCKNSAYTKCR